MTTALEQRSEGNAGLAAPAGQASIQFQDEGSNLGTAGTATTVNFTGAGVTASRATNTVTVNVPASGEAFPVGSIFLAAVSTNPATLLGYGTWSAIGAGRVLIGQDTGDTDFDTLGETGGAKTSSHSHTSGTLSTNTHGGHTHGVGTIATVAESSHTHGAGTIATVAESSHTHGAGTLAPSAHSGTAVADHSDNLFAHYHTPGTLATSAHSGTAVANHSTIDHRHVIGTSATITAHGTHSHGAKTANLTAGSNPYYDTATDPGNHTLGGHVDYSGQGELGHSVTQPSAHTISGQTSTNNAAGLDVPHSVTQPSAHTMSGSTAAGSSHSHGVSGSTAAGSSHSHGVSGSTASDGAHGHNVNSGSTGSTASSTVQPYLVVAMWQRTA